MKDKIEQVKKILENKNISVSVSVLDYSKGEIKPAKNTFCGTIVSSDVDKLATEINALYSEPQVCPACKGSGQAHYQRGLNDTPAIVEIRDCPDCNGTGCIPVPSTPAKSKTQTCQTCTGNGSCYWQEQGQENNAQFSFEENECKHYESSTPASVSLPPDELLTDVIKAIDELLSVSSYSEGIAGWHLNGEILKWEQCEFIQPLSELLPKLKEFQSQLLKCRQSEAARIKQLELGKKLSMESDNRIEQAIGKVLGYPAYKDDQKNFPNATESNGVCVGDHVAESLVMELVDRFKAIRADQNKKIGEWLANGYTLKEGYDNWREAGETLRVKWLEANKKGVLVFITGEQLAKLQKGDF